MNLYFLLFFGFCSVYIFIQIFQYMSNVCMSSKTTFLIEIFARERNNQIVRREH